MTLKGLVATYAHNIDVYSWPQPKVGPLFRLFLGTFMFNTSLDCSERQLLSSRDIS